MKDLYQLTSRVSTDFAAAVFIGWLIGYGLDYFFKTAPWCMVVFIFLGIIAGGLNVCRFVVKRIESSQKDD